MSKNTFKTVWIQFKCEFKSEPYPITNEYNKITEICPEIIRITNIWLKDEGIKLSKYSFLHIKRMYKHKGSRS